MKKIFVLLLAIMLSLNAFSALAEMDISVESDLPIEEDGLDLDGDIELSAVPDLTVEAPEEFREEAPAVSNPASDFKIVNGKLIEYTGSASTVVIPNSVRVIGYGAFEFKENMVAVTIPSSVTKIEGDAFSNCTALTSISIPASVRSIGRYCFSNCTSLTSIVLSEGLRTLEDHVFFMDEAMKAVTLPTTLTTLPEDVFMECFNVEVCVYAGSDAEYKAADLYDIKKLTVLSSTSNVHYLTAKASGATLKAATGDTLVIKVPDASVKEYKSSDKKIATVSGKGKVKILKKGSVTITATLSDGSVRTFKLSVSKSVKPKRVRIDQGSSITMRVGAKLQLSAKLSPSNGRSKLYWSSSGKKVADVSSCGVVTAKKPGTAIITVKTKNGKKATIIVNVTN